MADYIPIRFIPSHEFDAFHGVRPMPSTCDLTPAERIVLDAITAAAENDEVCPNVLDLLEIIGCESLSTPSVIVRRLEDKGLITVVRYQRFRRVQIIATGKWTARSPSMHVERPHVPRGAGSRSPAPTERKLYKSRRK